MPARLVPTAAMPQCLESTEGAAQPGAASAPPAAGGGR